MAIHACTAWASGHHGEIWHSSYPTGYIDHRILYGNTPEEKTLVQLISHRPHQTHTNILRTTFNNQSATRDC